MSNFVSRELLDENHQLAFLGTMAGDQIKEGKKVYYRTYHSFGGSDSLRQKISLVIRSSFDGEKLKQLGEEYSFTPFTKRDGRKFGFKATDFQGGGFFLTLETSNKNNLEYVIHKLEPQISKLTALESEEFVKQVGAYGSDYFIHHFFDEVEYPKDGDLVVYPNCDHYGIFRESERNWNSPFGGTVESKWDVWQSPFVFQHDFFFVPLSFGNNAKIYRLKDQSVLVEKTNIQKLIHENDFIYFPNSTSDERRKICDRFSKKDLIAHIPDIEWVSYIKFFGRCHHYAFGKFLREYGMIGEVEVYGKNILDTFFMATKDPKPGDLVVYYAHHHLCHWGVYLGNGKVESKWGLDSVYRHHFFDVPSEYGNKVICYQLKVNVSIEVIKQNIKRKF